MKQRINMKEDISVVTIDQYLAQFPPAIRKILEELRAAIKSAAPDAVEKISYQMPAFALKGNLVYFAAFKSHIGFYPGSAAVTGEFKKELAEYECGRGSVRFPLDKPLPLPLIRRIVKFRIAENQRKARHAETRRRGART